MTSGGAPHSLTPEQWRHVRFVLDIVDLLAADRGFDPEALVNPRTGAALGPVIARMREAVADPEAVPKDASPGD